MAWVPIEDIDDPRIAPYRDLHRSNLTRDSGLFVVEGRLLVERLVASSYDVDSALVDARCRDRLPAGIPDGVPIYVVGSGLVERVVGFNFHRGMLACGRRRAMPRLLESAPIRDESATVVCCVDVQDPTNLGGILRNCAAFGAHAVLLSRHCADPFSRRVLRVSMGTVFQLSLISATDLDRGLMRLRDDFHFQLVAAVLDQDAELLEQANRPPRLALLFGNEGYGLPASVLAHCSRRITVPMHHGTDSLNASVASGVFLYHFTRVARVD